jgi:hypothetical protein
MHFVLRGLSLAFLLLASIGGPASAMDQSAMEETNCLTACDANQEHCASTPHVAAPRNDSRNYSVAARLPSVKIKPLASSRRPIEGH